jgi:hypothetical protein
MELFQQTFSMFKPFVPPRASRRRTEKAQEPATDEANIDDLRRQMKDMRDRLDRMSKSRRRKSKSSSLLVVPRTRGPITTGAYC